MSIILKKKFSVELFVTENLGVTCISEQVFVNFDE